MPFKHSGLSTSFLLPLSEALYVSALQTAVKQCQNRILSSLPWAPAHWWIVTLGQNNQIKQRENNKSLKEITQQDLNEQIINFKFYNVRTVAKTVLPVSRMQVVYFDRGGSVFILLMSWHHEQKACWVTWVGRLVRQLSVTIQNPEF